METAPTRHDSLQAIFKDGLGTRYRGEIADGPCDILVLRDAFARIPSFEFLVRERVNRLAHVRSAHFARVYEVEHVADGAKIALVSKAAVGVRLSRMLAVAEQNLLPLDVESALCLIERILDAMAELHEDAPDACHGTLAAERIIVTSTARVVIVEHVLGAALAQLRYSPERYWKELRIALPIAVHSPLLDRRADVAQIGMIALALLLGRPLTDDEYPSDVAQLANGSFGLGGGFEPFPEWLRGWLVQALSLEPTRWFASAVEAREAFETGLKGGQHKATPEKLEAFLREYTRFDVIEAERVPAAPAIEVAQPQPAAVVPTPESVIVTPTPVSTPIAAPAHAPAPAPVALAASPTVVPFPAAVASPAVVVPADTVSPAASTPKPVIPAPAPVVAPEPVRTFSPSPIQRRDEELEMPKTLEIPGNARAGSNRPRLVAAAVVVIALTSGGAMAARRYFAAPPATAPSTGTVVVNTDPAGANVVIDGQARGVTPTTVTVNAGSHTIELSKDGVSRTLTVHVAVNAQVSQFVEMPRAAVGTGDLQVRTDPPGARVSVDGQGRGVTPVNITGLAPGSHTVVLQNDLGSVSQDVAVQAGVTASLVVPMKAPQGAPVSGWISISAPAELQIFEDKRLLGSSRMDRIMVATGRHDIEFVNDALGYRSAQTVQVSPGQVARVRPDWPQGTIAINATPWANVTLDGQELGETPVGNTAVPIGTHEVVFRHPQLGEQRFTATVTATAPARLSVDMRKK